MKGFCRIQSACRKWGGIHLVDKCLLVILILLMLQSALNLFLHEQIPDRVNDIDVVVRTSAAGIFGYLVSANFNQNRKRGADSGRACRSAPAKLSGGAGGITAQIGFQPADGGEGKAAILTPPSITADEQRPEHRCDRAQILVVATVGIVSLLILLLFRNLMAATDTNAGSLAQFRDFVSGSVGFLISCSTSGINAAEK